MLYNNVSIFKPINLIFFSFQHLYLTLSNKNSYWLIFNTVYLPFGSPKEKAKASMHDVVPFIIIIWNQSNNQAINHNAIIILHSVFSVSHTIAIMYIILSLKTTGLNCNIIPD